MKDIALAQLYILLKDDLALFDEHANESVMLNDFPDLRRAPP
jgi:hypothetical protein